MSESETYRLLRCPHTKLLHAYSDNELRGRFTDRQGRQLPFPLCGCCELENKAALEPVAAMPGELLAAARNLEGVHRQLSSEIAARTTWRP